MNRSTPEASFVVGGGAVTCTGVCCWERLKTLDSLSEKRMAGTMTNMTENAKRPKL